MLTQTKLQQTRATERPLSIERTFLPNGHPAQLFGCGGLTGALMTFERNAEIFGEGEPAEYVYRVTSGAVRTYRILSDGRRQINAFYLAGDLFALELSEEHSCSAEAITESKILCVRRSLVFKSADNDSTMARQLWSLTASELKRAQGHALLLIKNAQERIAAFLLEMSERLTGKGTMELPMSRQDIADYLGLTIETVSRTLSLLAHDSTIQLLASRRVVLRNRSVLNELNS